MKRIVVAAVLVLTALATVAAPAKRGLWASRTTAEGANVAVELRGDETLHFWQDRQGNCYTEDDNGLLHRHDDMKQLRQSARQTRAVRNRQRQERRLAARRQESLTGTRRGLIILTAFAEQAFRPEHDNAFYQTLANASNYSDEATGLRGSVHDYFLAQSGGQLKLRFDVVGPVTLKHETAYYGAESDDGERDVRPGEMVKEACEAVAHMVDFADYDWDGDGETELVSIVYAGEGQATGGGSDTVWPHEWALSEALGKAISIGGTQIDIYACSPELAGQRQAGIGTLCHEYAHCMGLPDLYDMSDEGEGFGMGHWSLMDEGLYNGDGFCPCNFTSWERTACGWMYPEVATGSTDVAALLPLSEGDEAWMIENSSWPDECYLLENRQQTGWDEALPGSGLLVLHVDFDKAAWDNNKVNDADVQRCTIFHADNEEDDESGDAYPWNGNDRLTATSVPAATVNHAYDDGRTTMAAEITDIVQNADGTVGFSILMEPTGLGNDTLFYESFDKCASTGGNDGRWESRVALGQLLTDNEGWEGVTLYGGDRCARVGNTTKFGYIKTPSIRVSGTCRLRFKAAPWGDEENFMFVVVDEGDAELEELSYETMTYRQWNETDLLLTGTGRARLNIYSNQYRFFLDEVVVTKEDDDGTVTQIAEKRLTDRRKGIFTLDGRRVKSSLNNLAKGIYIVDGIKIVK